MAYEKDTIASIVEQIDSKKIYLPAIQRKFVWSEEQITKLMDSIMRGYPFGTFLFWKVKKSVVNSKNYSLYEFIKDYHERDRSNNDLAGIPFNISSGNEDETILSALDGQQRLTALYIALKGSLSLKIPHKHKSNDDAYPKRELYFDLRSKKVSEDDDIIYSFAFLTSENAEKSSGNALWYRVKDIVQFSDIGKVANYAVGKGWSTDETVMNNILSLFRKLKDESCKLINYFEVASDSIDDVLDIFVRVNSGGTVLSKTDLIFSTIVSFWDKAREEVDNLLTYINGIGDHYCFTNDFVMRTCLYVTDLNINLKVENFNRESVTKIKTAWPQIKEAIKDTVKNALSELGFNSQNIIAYNAIYPIIYYRYKYGEDAFKDDYDKNTKAKIFDEKMEIRKYLVISQIRHIFGKATTTALTTIRTELKKYNSKFRFSYLQDVKFSNEQKLKFDENDLENWVDTFEKNEHTFLLLSLLYPYLRYGQMGFHQDHMHPYISFESDEELKALVLPEGKGIMDSNKIAIWRQQRNTLANLQLLEGKENERKSTESLVDWLSKPENMAVAKIYLPENMDYSLANFDDFIEARKGIMLAKLKEILL